MLLHIAKAIARQVGIISEGSYTVDEIAARRSVPVTEVDEYEARAAVVTGTQLKEMTSSDLDHVLKYRSFKFSRGNLILNI